MVALSMATSAMPPQVSVDLIQNAAVERGFSRKGEMYSCDNLCALAKDFLGGSADAEVRCDILVEIGYGDNRRETNCLLGKF